MPAPWASPLGYKDMRIRKSEFVEKTQFLCLICLIQVKTLFSCSSVFRRKIRFIVRRGGEGHASLRSLRPPPTIFPKVAPVWVELTGSKKQKMMLYIYNIHHKIPVFLKLHLQAGVWVQRNYIFNFNSVCELWASKISASRLTSETSKLCNFFYFKNNGKF